MGAPQQALMAVSSLLTPAKHFTADTVSGSDGDAIATWTDTGTLAQDATATGTEKPLLRVAAVNGHKALQGDGVNDKMSFTAVSSAGSYSIISVQKRGTLTGIASSFGSSPAVAHPPYGPLEYAPLSVIFASSRTSQFDGALPTAAYHVLSLVNTAGTPALWIDGAPITLSNTYPDSGTADFDRLFSRTGEFWDVYLAECLFFSSAISTGDRQAWEVSLKNTYNTP